MNENTQDLAKFGARERWELKNILEAWENHGLPKDFEDSEVRAEFNPNSGNVFLVNSEFQVAMLSDGKLEQWFSCPQCGNEGFDDEKEYPFKKYEGYCSKECKEKND